MERPVDLKLGRKYQGNLSIKNNSDQKSKMAAMASGIVGIQLRGVSK